MVETSIIPTEKGHIRKHKVYCEKDCEAYDAGFAVPLDFSNIENSDTGFVTGDGETIIVNCQPNMNLINPKTAIRGIKYELLKGMNEIETEVVYPKELLGE